MYTKKLNHIEIGEETKIFTHWDLIGIVWDINLQNEK
jgi:hypothetical protein